MHSVVRVLLADIPLDIIVLATMHVILVITKKIYAWLVKLLATLEWPEEPKQPKK